MPMLDCRNFNGYKPCGKSAICDSLCPHLNIPAARVLIVHLEALGAVLRSTALLPAIRRKFPGAHITWVTQKPAEQLLLNNPYIDRVLTTTTDDLLQLSALEFDVAYAVDKGLKTAGVLRQTHADLLFGFDVDPSNGAVIPATAAAQELWEIGLSNQKKFFENRKAETQLAHEALELGTWIRDEYTVRLTEGERKESVRRRRAWLGGAKILVGLNTGCSGTIQAKKLSVETQRELVERLTLDPSVRVVLLGGKEDTARNQRIGFGLSAIQSPTESGLRDGLTSVEACDVVVTGDSLGMHMAIALQKWTVAWFGPTCAHEIDLYGRGAYVLTQASCSPCWKRSCDKNPMCYDLVSVDELLEAVKAAPIFKDSSERISVEHSESGQNSEFSP
jgi:heptosyltransferase-2